ncbi:hypothetical protein ACIBG8_12715 [Nonomuraea sp. NPDC050556]|uniref:hypothetical protein n=1 Tax=Nonomuraea sp. NPDC050556 TaxID=3364369 RepID=UPI00378ABE3D
MNDTRTAVFVDQSGRRRRILMIVGVLTGTLAVACVAILIGGAFTSTSFSVIGWPGSEQTADPLPTGLESVRTPTPSRTASPRPSRTPGASPTASRTATPTPSRTRTTTPASTAKPSPSPSPSASGTPSDSPTTQEPGHTPPGKTKEPPGLDPDKTHGPKQ